MNEKVQFDLLPLGISIEAERNAPLAELLAGYGIEFPCGGAGTCGACRVRVIEGHAEATPSDREVLSPEQVGTGWRLACCMRATTHMAIEVAQWTMPILSDELPAAQTASDGIGIAIDLGTTTIVAQAVDLRTGNILSMSSLLNPQAAYGADVMSRVQLARHDDILTGLIRGTLGQVIEELARGRESELREVVIAGNTVMHHLFSGLDVEPLSHVPFESPRRDEQRFTPRMLQWSLPATCTVRFLPCIGGFVGSDILAGIVAVGLHQDPGLRAFIDLGTNGEIALGNETGILCASTAAGTAFEAGTIKMGMRAATGAISHAAIHDGRLVCSVIGGREARGICGSGLVDAAACFLDLGEILPSGRLANRGAALHLSGEVRLTQADIRELQLAKGAIAAGLRILLDRWGARPEDLEAVYLAGAFGNYVRVESAIRIGLFPVPLASVRPAGNTALRGAKMFLSGDYEEALRRTEHVSLAADADFQDVFAENLGFPPATDRRACSPGAERQMAGG